MENPLSHLHGEFHWREIALGVGLFGIAAYFLWPNKDKVQPLPGQVTTPPTVTVPGIPDYLSYNRPGYAVAPTGSDLAQFAWPAVGNLGQLALPGGLFKQPDGSITGGNFVGGNYVGARTPIYNAGAVVGPAFNVNAIRGTDVCGC